MKPIIFKAPDDLATALERRRKDTGCSVSEYIRRSVRHQLEKENRLEAEAVLVMEETK